MATGHTIPEAQDIANRIKALREDLEISAEEMAKATGRAAEDYLKQESGEWDLTFTFIYESAKKLGVDVAELLTGETPHLNGYEITRAGEGVEVDRHEQFDYLHKSPLFKQRLCEPFVVTAPYNEALQNVPIHLSKHEGQELDFIISGKLKFAYEDRTEVLNPGDCVLYDSGRGHGLIAIDGTDCQFLAVVLKPDKTK